MKKIHINCDLGEGGDYDQELMPLISACNIACGGHAGTLDTMQHTVDLAMKHKVQIGAHPSYPDKENFGRFPIKISEKELRRSLVAQILSLKQITEAEGAVLHHVKPHGALYNIAQKDPRVSGVIIDSILEFGNDLILFAPEHSVLRVMAEDKLQIKFEAFADRQYHPDSTLVERADPEALITQKEKVLEHLLSMVNERMIRCKNGQKIGTQASTYCLHSDTPNSEEILTFLSRELSFRNIEIFKAE